MGGQQKHVHAEMENGCIVSNVGSVVVNTMGFGLNMVIYSREKHTHASVETGTGETATNTILMTTFLMLQLQEALIHL